MVKYPIPPEALPSVLRVWVWTRENTKGTFTIRHAQWAARLYATIEDIGTLAINLPTYSLMEISGELTGTILDLSSVDLIIFNIMTGLEMSPKRRNKILGLSEEE